MASSSVMIGSRHLLNFCLLCHLLIAVTQRNACYFHQGGYVFVESVHLGGCLCAKTQLTKLTQIVVNGFWSNFLQQWSIWPKKQLIRFLVVIRITIQIVDLDHDPDPGICFTDSLFTTVIAVDSQE